jgi:uncharacterized protein (DUF983 family)
MTQTTATAKPAAPTAAPAASPFEALVCPRCLNGGGIDLRLNDLDTVTCHECGEEYSLDLVRDMVTGWARVLKWVDAAPTF